MAAEHVKHSIKFFLRRTLGKFVQPSITYRKGFPYRCCATTVLHWTWYCISERGWQAKAS